MKGFDKQNDEKAKITMAGFSDHKVIDVFAKELANHEPDMIIVDYLSAFPLIVADQA